MPRCCIKLVVVGINRRLDEGIWFVKFTLAKGEIFRPNSLKISLVDV